MIRANVQINDNGFIFSRDLGTTFTSNRSGVEVLKMLQQGFPQEKVKAGMMELFGISETEFDKDFQDFLVQLRNLRLLI